MCTAQRDGDVTTHMSESQYEQSFETKGTVETDWVYEAGLYDPSILPIFDAAIQGFVGQ